MTQQMELFAPFLITCCCGAGDEIATLADAIAQGWTFILKDDTPDQDGFGWSHYGLCPDCSKETKA